MEPQRRFGICISGKRKSGKDFIADRLTQLICARLGDEKAVVQLRIAESLKKRFAEIHGIDGEKLMGTSEYKDVYRVKMIEWSENERQTSGDLNQFCRAAAKTALLGDRSSARVWIIVDCRRHFEVNYFLLEDSEGRKLGSLFHAVTARVVATENTREKRGWKFIKGADDIDSECGLDDWPKWDYVIKNDDIDLEALDCQLTSIVDLACASLS